MNHLKTLYVIAILGLLVVSCNNDDDNPSPIALNAGTLNGGPFTFTVDGTPDMVSGITIGTAEVTGDTQTFVITDDANNILGLPPDMTELEGVDFDAAGTGVCLIWYLTYNDGLTGLQAGNNVSDFDGDYALSNSITVTRNGLNAGMLSGGPFTFTVDGTPDMVSGITLDAAALTGTNQTYVITDDARNILGLPPTLTDVEGVNFDGAGAGECYIYHLTYEDDLTGLEAGNNIDDFAGNYAISNFIKVTRNALNAGVLSGGPFEFVVDGTPDMVSGVTLDASMLTGTNQTYVITDDARNILGLPPTLADVEGVDFDGAGAGECYIYHLTYEDDLTGLEAGNNIDDFAGNYAISNFIKVTRNALNAGVLSGGPFNFTIDGVADMVSGISLDDSNVNGTNQGYVITDADLNILGLPPTLTDVEGVDFDGAGVGVCLIWHATFEDDLVGLVVGENVANLQGNYALSNEIVVNRAPSAGILSGGPFTFTVDGAPDMISGIILEGTVTGSNQSYIITDADLNILGLPPTLTDVEGVDFDAAGVGVCLIWHASYEDGIEGLEVGMNAADLSGLYSLSNSITVTRQ